MYAGSNNTELCPTRFFTGEPLYRDGQAPDDAEIARRVGDLLAALPRRPARRAGAAEGRARPRRAVRRAQHQERAALVVRRHAAAHEPGHRRRQQLRAVAARRAGRGVRRAGPLQPCRRRPLQGRPHHAPLRPPRSDGVHAVQLEMCWRAYMDETPPYRWHDERAAEVTPLLRRSCRRCSTGARHEVARPVGRPRVDRRRLARRCAADASTPTAAGPRSRRTRPAPTAPPCCPARRCPAWSTRTATPSSAPLPAWPSAALGEHDDFWSWRDRMYGVALRLTPGAAARHRGAAATSSCWPAATPRSASSTTCTTPRTAAATTDPLAMSRALAEAAAETGIGLTLLPVLYERAGFQQPHAARRPAPLRHRCRDRDRAARRRARARSSACECRRRDPLAARRVGRVDPRPATAPGRRPGADPHPRRRADRRGRRLPGRHRRAADRVAVRSRACSMRAGSWCTPRTPRRRRSKLSAPAAPAS